MAGRLAGKNIEVSGQLVINLNQHQLGSVKKIDSLISSLSKYASNPSASSEQSIPYPPNSQPAVKYPTFNPVAWGAGLPFQ